MFRIHERQLQLNKHQRRIQITTKRNVTGIYFFHNEQIKKKN